MSNVVELLLREREKSYEVLIKNSNDQPIMVGHCPDCEHEHQQIDFKEDFISPTPIEHETKPDHHYNINQNEHESESDSESESESESESFNESESNNEDDDLMFL